jgi:galactose oxidase
MRTLSSLCVCSLSSLRIHNKPSLKIKRYVTACLLLVFAGGLIQPFAQTTQQAAQQNPQRRRARPAQPGQERPFVEPVEMHKAALRVLETQPGLHGRWDTLPQLMPINPVHVALMHNSKVLVISGSGNDPNNKDFQAGVWDPATANISTFPIRYDMFCNGMVILPNGRPFVLGGTLKYDDFLGQPKTATFDPTTETFTDTAQMNGGRWYPVGTVLGNGSVLVESGLTNTSSTVNTTVQIFVGGNWTSAGTIFAGVPLYPRQHLLPDGKVFECGANQDSKMFDPATNAWFEVATTNLRANRDYGTSVLLPLSPANNYQPRVMILGGVTPNATNTTELIDLSVPQPVWVNGPNMSQARIQLNATILPNGRVLVSGGSSNDENGATASLETQLYDADANSFSPGSPMAFARLYHSNTLLLPDATVLAVGGNPVRTVYEPHIEIYSPPYLFNADGSPATRPVISAIDQAIRYGANFYIRTPYPADIKSVVMIRPGAVTHSFDMEQRLVHLSFTSSNGQLYVKAPPNGNIAPPGYYMVFILDSKGVPSKAAFVHLT